MAATPYTPVTQRLNDRILEDEKDWKIQQIQSCFDMFRKEIQDHATQVGQAGQAHTTQSTPEWEIRSQWRFCPTGEETYIPLHRTPSPPPTTQSTPEWCKDDSPEGGRVYTPGLYDEDRDDEIPDIATLRVTDNEEEENVGKEKRVTQ